jgi:cellulose 1,4-beta-cellobiosidase
VFDNFIMVKFASLLVSCVTAQQAGKINSNDLVPFSIGECTADGSCKANTKTKLSLDSNWRWTHEVDSSENCYTANEWKTKSGEQVCEDGQTKTCAKKCAVGAWPKEQWQAPYGVNHTSRGVDLGFVTQGPYSINVGTRLFVTEGDEYKQFHLLGKEMSVTVDMSNTYCGLNGAIYFVEMDRHGDKGVGDNNAGPEYGTGYCDAQCPRDLKWIKGKANIKPHWVPTQKDPMHNIGQGGRGVCCAELDMWEANKHSMQLALHPMATEESQTVCYQDAECGSQQDGKRDIGPTDRNGCYLNPYMFGHKKFYGPGEDYAVNTQKPFTIVTEFREKNGELEGMYQSYYQNGKKIEQPEYGFGSGNAMTDDFCKKSFEAHSEVPLFQQKGGMKQFSKAVKRGMTMVVSFWDDMATNMNWLDSGKRGTCNPDLGDPKNLREKHPDASFGVRNVRWGPIGSTHKASELVV